MNFSKIVKYRQSCRSYDPSKEIEEEKIAAILESARFSPSACNGQPYHITVCKGGAAKEVAKATMSMGMNKFTADAPVQIVVSEDSYVRTASVASRVTGIDYRSIDIGIVAAYITAEATSQGLGSCIIGWFDNKKITKCCDLKGEPRLVISLGYAKDDKLRTKKRKDMKELVTVKE